MDRTRPTPKLSKCAGCRAKTGDERLSMDAMAVIMEEEKANQKRNSSKSQRKKSAGFCAGDAHAEDRGHHCQGAGTLPQTPAQFREIAHSQGGSAPICGKTAASAGSSPHLTLPNNLNSLKRRYSGAWMFIKAPASFHRQTSGCEENRRGSLFRDSAQHKPQHIRQR